LLLQTLIVMNHFAASRDPDVFDEPDRFLPERWMRSDTRTAQLHKHPFASLPFGFGSRSCIGLSHQNQTLFSLCWKVFVLCVHVHARWMFPHDSLV